MIVIKTDVFNKHYLTKLEVSNRAKPIFLVLGVSIRGPRTGLLEAIADTWKNFSLSGKSITASPAPLTEILGRSINGL